ncbi:MAG: GNAT family N-acetyltransferase [Bacteroidetes bacterium]|nr:MAG: GNAT family N-acetyltransferase [Bacteroidota bacterium]
MIVVEVTNNKQAKQFIKVPHLLYKDDEQWVSPLDQDIEDVFDENQNPFYKNGELKRWLLFNNKNRLIGRVAAFYNQKYIEQSGKRVGGMGFFECINNQEAAFLLFDTCRNWLKSKNITSMDGPINFGEKDRFWGLMVEGFKNPSYLENYNPPFYQHLFEAYGFVKLFEQSTSEITAATFNHARFSKIASRVLQNPAYRFEHYADDQIDRFAKDFVHIYNLAWAHRPDFTPMTMERVMITLKALRPILKEDIIWFAYANNEPAGFYVNTIDVNQIFKHLRGKMNWWAKIKFVWYRKFGRVDRARGIVFGIIPKYQNLGLEAGMIMKFYEAISKTKYLRASELSWIGDFNPKMHSLFEALGAKQTKMHYTYQYQFND